MSLNVDRVRPVIPGFAPAAPAARWMTPRVAWAVRPAARASEDAAGAAARLVGPVAHELRNFIAPMRLSVAALQRGATHDASTLAGLQMLRGQIDDLSRLVGDLVDAARVEAGKLEMHMAPCVLQDIAAQAVQMCEPTAREWGQALRLECAPQPVRLEGDALRLRQALANLVFNAVRYSPPGGTVRVEACTEAGCAVLRVHDDGRGMAPELAARVFDLHVQGEGEGAAGGLGIGLYLVRSIARMHGGRARVESPGPGFGTTFSIELPLPVA
jgi:signal transduction histidine kinase